MGSSIFSRSVWDRYKKHQCSVRLSAAGKCSVALWARAITSLVIMDEELHKRLLAYVTEPTASLSCRSWHEYLHETLHLGLRAGFNRTLANKGKVFFCYDAVRPLAE